MSYVDETYSDARSGLPGYSQKETMLIGDEIRRLVDEAMARATQVLRDSRPALERIAVALLEHETVSAAQLEALVRDAHISSTDG